MKLALKLLTTTAAVALAFPAFAQTTTTETTVNATTEGTVGATTGQVQSMTDWDSDTSGNLSRDEWSTGLTGSQIFTQWDTDANQSLSGSEFGVAAFSRFDANGDASLDQTEWDAGVNSMFSAEASGLQFSGWDADANGTITEAEFTQGFESAGLFDTFRTSGNLDVSADGISADDFSNTMFDRMDTNRDGNIGSDEDGWFR